MGKVITIKNNKGGVGKSWLTLQLGHLFSLLESENGEKNKVLIITSDAQNNVMLYAGIDYEIESGLEDRVLKGTGDLVRLRENLFYIPLLKNTFTKTFKEKLEEAFIELKKEYDYILIDSVPTMSIDAEFVELADKVVIPTMLDTASCKGILNLSNEIDLKKVAAIVPNKYSKTKSEKFWLGILADFLKGNSIYFADPVSQSAFIAELTHNGKTIFETSSKKAEEFQDILVEIAKVIAE